MLALRIFLLGLLNSLVISIPLGGTWQLVRLPNQID